MSRESPWSRHSYPIQNSLLAPLVDLASDMGIRTPREASKLPRYMRAVKNAENFKPGGRTILIFLDGTGDQFDNDNSNIVHMVSCLKKDDPSQLSYYQSGIGTYDGGGLSNGISAAIDMAVGSGLGVHIRDAYHFLMQNYKEDDKICLFGFSRGAYTARCLAGMLHKVGLLPAHNDAQIPFAYKFYKDDSLEGWKMSGEFKQTFCIDINVYFIGVFDSVASVGFIPRKLPLSSTPTNKSSYFRHAMALDEHRAKFKSCRYKQRDQIDPKSKWKIAAETHQTISHPAPSGLYINSAEKSFRADSFSGSSSSPADEMVRDNYPLSYPAARTTDVLEVWFTGCHADVGGGAVKNEVRHKLSQVPLRWMIRQCFECDTGIVFHTSRLADMGLDVQTLWPSYHALPEPIVGPPPSLFEKYEKGKLKPIKVRSQALKLSTSTDSKDNDYYFVDIWKDDSKVKHVDHWLPEQYEDYFDSMADINDQLVQAKGWWVLEFWPIKVRIQPHNSDDWVKKVAFNLGRFRPVQELEPNLHWTVRQRMHDKMYKLRTRVDKNAMWKIVV